MWEELTDEQSGEVPEARSVFGATRMSENEIFLFGGAAAENACVFCAAVLSFLKPDRFTKTGSGQT